MSHPDPLFLLSAGVEQAVERVLAVAYGNIYVGSSPTIGIILYVFVRMRTFTDGNC